MNSVDRVKELCKNKKIPISRLEKDLGYSNGYIGQLRKGVFPSDRLLEIASYLDVSVEFLMNGNEKNVPISWNHNEKDVEKILAYTAQLLRQDNLTLNGKPISHDAVNSILSALQIGIEMAKKY